MNAGEFDEIAEIGYYDYDWHLGYLLRHVESGTLFFAATSGCSCYGFWDNLEPDDLIQVDNWQSAVDAAREEFSDSEVFEFAKRLNEMSRSTS